MPVTLGIEKKNNADLRITGNLHWFICLLSWKLFRSRECTIWVLILFIAKPFTVCWKVFCGASRWTIMVLVRRTGGRAGCWWQAPLIPARQRRSRQSSQVWVHPGLQRAAEGCTEELCLGQTNKRKEPKYHGGAFHSCGNRENFLEIMFTLELQAAVTAGFTWIWEFRWDKSCTVQKVRSCASLVRGKMISCPLRNDVLVPRNRTER